MKVNNLEQLLFRNISRQMNIASRVIVRLCVEGMNDMIGLFRNMIVESNS